MCVGDVEVSNVSSIDSTSIVNKQRIVKINDVDVDKRPFLYCKTASSTIRWLADTGATDSVLSKENFERVREVSSRVDIPVPILKGASDRELKTYGIYRIPLEVDGKRVFHTVIVVDQLASGAILGMDFLGLHNAVVLAKQRQVIFPWSPVRGTLKAMKSTVLPAMCIKPVRVRVETVFGKPLQFTGVTEGYFDEPQLEILESIVEPGPEGIVDVVLCNYGYYEVRLRPQEEIGKITEVREMREISEIINELKLQAKKAKTVLTQDKVEFIQKKANIGGSEQFKRECSKLLLKYHSCISRDKYDLGGSDFMQHRIHLTDTMPVHSKQFRIPWAHREHINDFVDKLLDRKSVV